MPQERAYLGRVLRRLELAVATWRNGDALGERRRALGASRAGRATAAAAR